MTSRRLLNVLLFLGHALALATGCSTTKPAADAPLAVVVVSRIDSLSKSPEWTQHPNRFRTEGGRLVLVHALSLGAESTVEHCLGTLEKSGRNAMVSRLQEALNASSKVRERDDSIDAATKEVLVSLEKGEVPSTMVVREGYWEKRVEPRPNGVQALVLYCAVKVGLEDEGLLRLLRGIDLN
jgi:hypothetical protein